MRGFFLIFILVLTIVVCVGLQRSGAGQATEFLFRSQAGARSLHWTGACSCRFAAVPGSHKPELRGYHWYVPQNSDRMLASHQGEDSIALRERFWTEFTFSYCSCWRIRRSMPRKLASWLPRIMKTPFGLPSRRWRKLVSRPKTRSFASVSFLACAITSPSH